MLGLVFQDREDRLCTAAMERKKARYEEATVLDEEMNKFYLLVFAKLPV